MTPKSQVSLPFVSYDITRRIGTVDKQVDGSWLFVN